MDFTLAGKYFYRLYKSSLCDLYINAFSQKPASQYHSRQKTQRYLDSVFNRGFGVFAISEHRLCGALLAVPLSFDKNLPKKISANYEVEMSLYIAEMMVDELFRGQGIGHELIIKFLKEVNTNCFSHVVIRVWDQNIPAIKLYEKMGFKPIASIIQPVLKVDKSEMMDFRKIYMVKEIKVKINGAADYEHN
ncbi:MAG TPA: GNAT family N-acetyltransferase [Prolixibacteraceae bacterium]|nr:GNAT family N-acetyltransferase [Prolixibacteraceae bacterium]